MNVLVKSNENIVSAKTLRKEYKDRDKLLVEWLPQFIRRLNTFLRDHASAFVEGQPTETFGIASITGAEADAWKLCKPILLKILQEEGYEVSETFGGEINIWMAATDV